MKKLEKLDGELFSKEKMDFSKVLGGLAPYNTYATSGAGGATPPAGTASDTNDTATSTANNGKGDWVNKYSVFLESNDC